MYNDAGRLVQNDHMPVFEDHGERDGFGQNVMDLFLGHVDRDGFPELDLIARLFGLPVHLCAAVPDQGLNAVPRELRLIMPDVDVKALAYVLVRDNVGYDGHERLGSV